MQQKKANEKQKNAREHDCQPPAEFEITSWSYSFELIRRASSLQVHVALMNRLSTDSKLFRKKDFLQR